MLDFSRPLNAKCLRLHVNRVTPDVTIFQHVIVLQKKFAGKRMVSGRQCASQAERDQHDMFINTAVTQSGAIDRNILAIIELLPPHLTTSHHIRTRPRFAIQILHFSSSEVTVEAPRKVAECPTYQNTSKRGIITYFSALRHVAPECSYRGNIMTVTSSPSELRKMEARCEVGKNTPKDTHVVEESWFHSN